MPQTTAIPAYGTFLKRGDAASPEAFTTILEVLDIKGPNLTLTTVDATNMSSPGGWEEVVPTILKSGNVTFSCNYVPTAVTQNVTAGLGLDMLNRTKRNFKLVFSDSGATTWTFAAYVVAVSPDTPVQGKALLTISLKLTGQPILV